MKMKAIEIFGENYSGEVRKTRVACRGIILDGNDILLSYETLTGCWMIPGGAVEGVESDAECCIREIAEETGVAVEVSDCVLEIDEYYEDCKWVNRYFYGKAVGRTEMCLTEAERKVGLSPRWLSVAEIKEIFSRHADYADTDEMRRGLYFREFTALCELGF